MRYHLDMNAPPAHLGRTPSEPARRASFVARLLWNAATLHLR